MLYSNSLLCIYLKSFKAPFLSFSCILYLGLRLCFLFLGSYKILFFRSVVIEDQRKAHVCL